MTDHGKARQGMGFGTAVRIFRSSKMIFARPKSWHGSGWAVDLGGKVRKDGLVCGVNPVGKMTIFLKDWKPTSDELVEDWFLATRNFLANEYDPQEDLTKPQESEQREEKAHPKERYGLEIAE